ncbi:MAG: hypothetical protein HY868_27240 [Chloroflexi bacterium]|nr:hypothetical protein [Chloroflexota bacterium]
MARVIRRVRKLVTTETWTITWDDAGESFIAIASPVHHTRVSIEIIELGDPADDQPHWFDAGVPITQVEEVL